jgi:hypothetical protein
MKVGWAAAAAPRTQNHQTTAEPPYPPRSRADRRLWYIAVGREINSRIAAGTVRSISDFASLYRVSKSRISHLVSPTQALSPQESTGNQSRKTSEF